MTSESARATFFRGAWQSVPILFVVVPFALLFGVVGTEAGLNLAEVMGFSILVIAGASQFTAIQLMTDNAATVIVLLTALTVNLRMAMYSAALTPHFRGTPLWVRMCLSYILIDQTYAQSALEFERRPTMTQGQKVLYFFGSALFIVPIWFVGTYTGAVLGQNIPSDWGLDFALPITFIALVAPALRTPAHIAAAFVSVSAALLFAWVPYNLGLIIASLVAMVTGAQVEIALQRRGKWT